SSLHNNEELVAGSLIDKIEDESLRSYIFELTFDKHRVSRKLDELKPVDEQKVLSRQTLDLIRKFKFIAIDKEISNIHNKIEEAKEEPEIIELIKIKQELFREKGLISEELNS